MTYQRRRTNRSTSRSTRTSARPGVAVFDTDASAGQESQPTSGRAINWEMEYGYVMRDIRYLLIISVIIFVLLIAVGFLI